MSTYTAIDVIKRSLRLLRVIDAELPLQGKDRANGIEALNGFTKYLQTKGFNLWREEEAWLPLVKGQQSYKLGEGGDIAFDEEVAIFDCLNAALTTGDTIITIDSTETEAAPPLLNYEPTSSLQDWTATGATMALVSSGIELTNDAAAAGYMEYDLDTVVGDEYIIYSTVDIDTAGTALLEARDVDGVIVSETLTADGDSRLRFTARQTTTTFRFTNNIATAALKNTLNTMNYINTAQGDKVWIYLDDGSTHVSNFIFTLEMATGVPSDAAEDNRVYSWEKGIERPLNVVNCRFRAEYDFTDIPTENWSRTEYFEQPDKKSTGQVTMWYYSPQLVNGILYVWQPAYSNLNLLPFSYIRPMDVTEENADVIDFPSEWYDLVCYNVASRLIAEYSVPDQRVTLVTPMAQGLLVDALAFDNEDTDISIQPDRNN